MNNLSKVVSFIILISTISLFATNITEANNKIKIGLSTQATECILIADGGGELRDLITDKLLISVKNGAKIKIIQELNITQKTYNNEFRIQVGEPIDAEKADVIIDNLNNLNLKCDLEKIFVPDGKSWRILIGKYKNHDDAVKILQKLNSIGYKQLWIVSEADINQNNNDLLTDQQTFYVVNDTYERLPLPKTGVRLTSINDAIKVLGKGIYRDSIIITSNNSKCLSIINEIDLEKYLCGVVPMEMSSTVFPEIEALKAQSVAARTYAIVNIGKRNKDGFDLFDTTIDQVYGGRGKEQDLTNKAVLETSGIIATYQNKPIQALFMANAGSATINNSFVFGDGYPYLKSVSNYIKSPKTILLTSNNNLKNGDWLNWDLLHLIGNGLLPISYLEQVKIYSEIEISDILPIINSIKDRLNITFQSCNIKSNHIYLWIAQELGFKNITDGIEQPQDALYLLGDAIADKYKDNLLLVSLLTRRGIVSTSDWENNNPKAFQVFKFISKLWRELEDTEFLEGVWLLNNQIRMKDGSLLKINSNKFDMLFEEGPDASLRLVHNSKIHIGDRVKFLIKDNAPSILVRKLHHNGTAINRYSTLSHWKTELKEVEIKGILYNKAGIKSLADMQLTHNENGRVISLNITDELGKNYIFTGMKIRNLLGLNDNVFRFIQTGKKPNRRWIIYGRGWGHGVGMDQTGAYGMALEGFNFKEILEYYYTGIELKKINSA